MEYLFRIELDGGGVCADHCAAVDASRPVTYISPLERLEMRDGDLRRLAHLLQRDISSLPVVSEKVTKHLGVREAPGTARRIRQRVFRRREQERDGRLPIHDARLW
jgi:hypothetical protein